MKAIRIDRTGGPDSLILVDIPLPDPGPGEVRLRVEACAVIATGAVSKTIF